MGPDDSCYRVWWDDTAEVVRTVWLPGARAGLDEAAAIIDEIHSMDRGRVLSLVDLRAVHSINRAARETFMSDHMNFRAVALLVDSSVSKMIANFFIGLRHGDIPVKMFTSEEQALAWLHEQP